MTRHTIHLPSNPTGWRKTMPQFITIAPTRKRKGRAVQVVRVNKTPKGLRL